jgi:hypothetical protein
MSQDLAIKPWLSCSSTRSKAAVEEGGLRSRDGCRSCLTSKSRSRPKCPPLNQALCMKAATAFLPRMLHTRH